MPAEAITDVYVQRLEDVLEGHREFRRHVVPLCAAETPISDFVRSFLDDAIHEKYAMGGPLSPPADNFIGAGFVLDLHRLTIDLCRDLFGVGYADPRPLSGTSAVTNLLMTLSEPGQRILLQTGDSGCHASMEPICRRLGLEIVDIPYDYERFQFDAEACSQLADDSIDFVLIAPSDILYPPPLDSLGFAESTTVIYDATQTLGLIASGHLPSPFDAHPRVVVSGGTHTTLPGPSSGLLLTNNEELAWTLDTQVSPKFVRHSQPHHIAGLCATLIETREVGVRYSDMIRRHATTLSEALATTGLEVLQDGERITETHQVFIHVPGDEIDSAYQRALEVGVTLNLKRRPLLHGTGLRLGVQEIARYRWGDDDVAGLASVIAALVNGEVSQEALRERVCELAAMNEFSPEMTVRPR